LAEAKKELSRGGRLLHVPLARRGMWIYGIKFDVSALSADTRENVSMNNNTYTVFSTQAAVAPSPQFLSKFFLFYLF
jgi:hypothetical protein